MRVFFTSCFVALLALASHAQTRQRAHAYFDNHTSQVARAAVEAPPQWGEVLFDNAVLVGHPEVTDPFVRVPLGGSRLVGTNFIAELYYGTNFSSMIRLSNAPPARFRHQGTSWPGTWVGAMRTLAGIAPGTQIYKRVVMWDNDAAESVEEAQRNHGPYTLYSSVFT